jgi:hypothetical protein
VTVEETEKEQADRQLIELLSELRVVLPGAQVLLAFLFTVPFATRFNRVTETQRSAYLACLLCTAVGTMLLMAPSVYHRLRWHQGGKADVVRVGHVLFLVGTAALSLGIAAAVFLVMDYLYGLAAAVATTAAVCAISFATWYLLPLARTRREDVRRPE